MQDLDKIAMGKRIRQIRTRAGLRQWELAKILGTTQSAVHKYEHGVVPEPRRLVELAKVGNTSVEWVLTGHHWENGSEDQNRLTPEMLETACLLREILDDERGSVDEALRIVREAVQTLDAARNGDDPGRVDPEVLAAALASHSKATLRLLENAYRIQRAIVRRVVEDAHGRLADARPPAPGARDDDEAGASTRAPARRRPAR